jgi:hypothetical protein
MYSCKVDWLSSIAMMMVKDFWFGDCDQVGIGGLFLEDFRESGWGRVGGPVCWRVSAGCKDPTTIPI